MNAATTLRAATREGAKVLGAESIIGSLEPGKKADLIGLDLDKPHLTPMYNVYSHLVYAASAADVVLAMINGRLVMQAGDLLTLDVEKVMAEVREIAKKIKN